MRLTVNVPATVSIAVIEGALQALGATIVRRKAKQSEEIEYPPLCYKKRIHAGHELANSPDAMQDETGHYLPMEMDGISVLKAIRKMDLARMAYNRADGRDAKDFPALGERMSTADYVAAMNRAWSLKACV